MKGYWETLIINESPKIWHSKEELLHIARSKGLDRYPIALMPILSCGDVDTIEIDWSKNIIRYFKHFDEFGITQLPANQ